MEEGRVGLGLKKCRSDSCCARNSKDDLYRKVLNLSPGPSDIEEGDEEEEKAWTVSEEENPSASSPSSMDASDTEAPGNWPLGIYEEENADKRSKKQKHDQMSQQCQP